MRTPPPGKPLSVIIGRIAVRLLLIGLLAWAAYVGYQTYVQHQRAQEIAPIQKFAKESLSKMKNQEYFSVQEILEPGLRHIVSIDSLAHFINNAELNATDGGKWGAWSKKEDVNKTIYTLDGNITYTTGRKNNMNWQIIKSVDKINISDLTIGKRTLRPPKTTTF